MKIKKIDDSLLRNIKLLFFDLDGTLLNKKGKVPESYIELIKRLKESGTLTTLASARLHTSISKIAETLEIDIPIISLDGALIKSRDNNIVLYQSNLRKAVVKKAIGLAEQYLLKIGICHSDEIFYTEDSSTLPMLLGKVGAKFTLVNSLDNYLDGVIEVDIVGDHKQNIQKVASRLRFPFALGTSVNVYRSSYYTDIFYLECKKSGSSKANALKKLIKYFKIKEKNVLVAGDWYNDIPVYETDTIKVALKNSIPALKKRANIILNKTNDEEGLKELLEKIIQLKNK